MCRHPGYSLGSALISNEVQQVKQDPPNPTVVSAAQTPTQMSETKALTTHQSWPTPHLQAGASQASQAQKDWGQSSWGLRGWGEGSFPAVLMGWTGIISRDLVFKARRMDALSSGLSSSLGLCNPCRFSPQHPPRQSPSHPSAQVDLPQVAEATGLWGDLEFRMHTLMKWDKMPDEYLS